MLAGIVESFALRAGQGASEFTVLSSDPEDTRKRHGLSAVHRMRMEEVRRAIRGCDLFLSGGGSLLQDTTSVRSLLYYLWVIRIAVALRKPAMFYAQGVGPLRRRSSRLMTRLVANRVQQITVRDPESASLLRQIGVNRPPIEVTADPAFALSPAPSERVSELLKEAGIGEGEKLVGIAPRPWHHRHPTLEGYAETARRVSSESGARIVLLPMQRPGDLELCEEIARNVDGAAVIRSPLSPQEAVGITGRLSGLIAMRLHALIFAAVAGVPMVALSYDPKVQSLMAALNQSERSISLDQFTPAEPADRLLAALNQHEQIQSDLRSRAAALRESTLHNVDLGLRLGH